VVKADMARTLAVVLWSGNRVSWRDWGQGVTEDGVGPGVGKPRGGAVRTAKRPTRDCQCRVSG